MVSSLSPAPSSSPANACLSAPRKRSFGGLSALRTPLSAALGLASLLAAGHAKAGAPYQAVWYPDGSIQWFNKSAENVQDPGEPRGQNIMDAMDYLEEHSPLSISQAASDGAANLHFTTNILLPSGVAMTDGYWNETVTDAHKNIDFSPNGTFSMNTVLHEFGHALGFPHEFQRAERDSFVDVCFNVDPWNYGKQGSAYWPDPNYLLSPYDFASVMNDGYGGCVTPLPGIPQQTRAYPGMSNNPLSVHDINSIYRMYGARQGANEDGDRFGHAVATGDYDDDGIEDIVVAKSDVNSDSTTTVILMFFRGVETDPSESGPGTRYVPWFTKTIDTTSLANPNTALATGDFNGDGIDDLAVGQPWYNGFKGRVQILFLNSGAGDTGVPSPQRAPWGRKGVRATFTILPADVGLSSTAQGKFGYALAAAHLTANLTSYTPTDDLIIGAPLYVSGAHTGGAVAIFKGTDQATVGSFASAATTVVYNPGSAGDEFGKAVTPLQGFCSSSASTADLYNDTFLAGAPGYSSDAGRVYLYGCATSTAHTLLTPSVLQTVSGPAASRYGAAMAGFRRRTSSVTTTYKYYAAIGAPSYSGSSPNPKSGIVYVDEYAIGTGTKTFIADFRPSTRSNDDEFGASLAVQQTAVSSSIAEGGKEVYLGIGMPGTQVSGFVAGKVYVWRPWNSDGTLNTTANVISATNPTSATDTRLGDAITVLRNLDSQGGFVAGAPESRQPDNTNSGSAKVLLNTASTSFSWTTWSTDIDEETEGDHRPTN